QLRVAGFGEHLVRRLTRELCFTRNFRNTALRLGNLAKREHECSLVALLDNGLKVRGRFRRVLKLLDQPRLVRKASGGRAASFARCACALACRPGPSTTRRKAVRRWKSGSSEAPREVEFIVHKTSIAWRANADTRIRAIEQTSEIPCGRRAARSAGRTVWNPTVDPAAARQANASALRMPCRATRMLHPCRLVRRGPERSRMT